MENQLLLLDSATSYSRFKTTSLKSGQQTFIVERPTGYRGLYPVLYQRMPEIGYSSGAFRKGSLFGKIGEESLAHDLFREIIIARGPKLYMSRATSDRPSWHPFIMGNLRLPTRAHNWLVERQIFNYALGQSAWHQFSMRQRFTIVFGKFGRALTHTNHPHRIEILRRRFAQWNVAHIAHIHCTHFKSNFDATATSQQTAQSYRDGDRHIVHNSC